MTASPSPTESHASEAQTAAGRQVRVELVAGLVSIAVAAFFLIGAGSGRLDWIFPDTLAITLGGIGVALAVRGLLGYGDLMPLVPPILRGAGKDVALFILIAVAYAVLVRPLGFWPVSGLMIFGTALYLTDRRDRRAVVVAAVIAVAVCVVAFLLLERVFYVPYPKVRWLPFR